jgi:hypothetical protein
MTHLLFHKTPNSVSSEPGAAQGDAMPPEEALGNILTLVDGSDEMEDVRALQILLQSIKTLAEKGLGHSE